MEDEVSRHGIDPNTNDGDIGISATCGTHLQLVYDSLQSGFIFRVAMTGKTNDRGDIAGDFNDIAVESIL